MLSCPTCRKKETRVDWLYSGPASSVNREEYLLGKKIDRLVDPTLAEANREKEVDLIKLLGLGDAWI